MSFKSIASGFNGAFWWVWSTCWRSRKKLTNLPKLSCGFNHEIIRDLQMIVIQRKIIQGYETFSLLLESILCLSNWVTVFYYSPHGICALIRNDFDSWFKWKLVRTGIVFHLSAKRTSFLMIKATKGPTVLRPLLGTRQQEGSPLPKGASIKATR